MVPSKQAGPVAAAIAAALGPLPPELRTTLTFDNGTEFARHFELNALGIGTYLLLRPPCSLAEGGIENAIGRLRRALPRKTDLAALGPSTLMTILAAYNATPRKCLDWLTPAPAFSAHLLHFKRESTSRLSPG